MMLLFFLVLIVAASSALWACGIFRWRKSIVGDPPELPTATILVAGRNEEKLITTCLRSLLDQGYPLDKYNIVFVDDHSTDATLRLAQSIADQADGRLKVLSAPDNVEGIGPKKNALRFGIAHASGEILAFLDADCRAESGWLASLMRAYDDTTGCVAGAVLPKKSGLAGRLRWLERLFISYTTASAMGFGFPSSASGGSFSYRRRLFDDLGGIAHSQVGSGDDDLMAQAIARRGWKVRFSHDPACVTEDLRPPAMTQYLHSATRHQSTVRYYALRWRLAYIFSIVANLILLGLWGVAVLFPGYLFPAIVAMVIKILLEGGSVLVFCRRLRIPLTVSDVVLAECVLPFYLLVRPLFAALPGYSWQNRTLPAAHLPGTATR